MEDKQTPRTLVRTAIKNITQRSETPLLDRQDAKERYETPAPRPSDVTKELSMLAGQPLNLDYSIQEGSKNSKESYETPRTLITKALNGLPQITPSPAQPQDPRYSFLRNSLSRSSLNSSIQSTNESMTKENYFDISIFSPYIPKVSTEDQEKIEQSRKRVQEELEKERQRVIEEQERNPSPVPPEFTRPVSSTPEPPNLSENDSILNPQPEPSSPTIQEMKSTGVSIEEKLAYEKAIEKMNLESGLLSSVASNPLPVITETSAMEEVPPIIEEDHPWKDSIPMPQENSIDAINETLQETTPNTTRISSGSNAKMSVESGLSSQRVESEHSQEKEEVVDISSQRVESEHSQEKEEVIEQYGQQQQPDLDIQSISMSNPIEMQESLNPSSSIGLEEEGVVVNSEEKKQLPDLFTVLMENQKKAETLPLLSESPTKSKKKSEVKEQSSIPDSFVRQLFTSFSRKRCSKRCSSVLSEITNQYLDNIAEQVTLYAKHGHRRTIDLSDIEILLKRQRIVNDDLQFSDLVHRYLPQEQIEELLPLPKPN